MAKQPAATRKPIGKTIAKGAAKPLVIETGVLIDSPVMARAEAMAAAAPEDFGEIYKVPARGNPGGGAPFELRRSGCKIKELKLWSEPALLRGVQVTFDDGAVMQAGSLNGRAENSITFHTDESITSTTICSSAYDAGRAGNIEIYTNFGQHYLGVVPNHREWLREALKKDRIVRPEDIERVVGELSMNNFTPYADSTKGSFIGVYGRAGSDLDSLGILLALPQDTEYEFYNVQYHLNTYKMEGEQLLHFQDQIVHNSTSVNQSGVMTFSKAYSESKNWSHTLGLKVGVKTSIKAGFPFLAEGKVEVSFEGSYSHTWGNSVTESVTRTWSSPVVAPPRTEVRGKATVHEATIDVPYTADLRIRRSDGTVKTVNSFSGVYRGVTVGRFRLDLEEVPLK